MLSQTHGTGMSPLVLNSIPGQKVHQKSQKYATPTLVTNHQVPCRLAWMTILLHIPRSHVSIGVLTHLQVTIKGYQESSHTDFLCLSFCRCSPSADNLPLCLSFLQNLLVTHFRCAMNF